jgi:SOS-response transcriptional repressor LexA
MQNISEISTYGDALKALLRDKKIPMKRVARDAHVSEPRLYGLFRSKDGSDIGRGEAFPRLAAYLGMTPEYLDRALRELAGLSPTSLERAQAVAKAQEKPPAPKPKRPYIVHDVDASRVDRFAAGITIPVYTRVSAGGPVDYQFGIMPDRFLPSSLLPHPEWGPGAFVVTGDSMAPYFQAGDILIIAERLQDVRTGDILIVCFTSGEHTVKKLRIVDRETWELIPINPNHERTIVKRTEIEWYVPVLVRIEPIYQRREVPWQDP